MGAVRDQADGTPDASPFPIWSHGIPHNFLILELIRGYQVQEVLMHPSLTALPAMGVVEDREDAAALAARPVPVSLVICCVLQAGPGLRVEVPSG
jgi:hypothetical protein